ncbi:MAG: YIP1 family protein [Ignavibacteria bacterium]|nr:YIP1 family protein [Ignavibacteria bacterium]
MTQRYALVLTFLFITSLCLPAADFSDYTQLGPQQVAAFMPSETRTIINLSGQWQRMNDGVPVETVSVPGSLESTTPVVLRRTIRIEQATLSKHTWHLQVLGVVDEIELRVNGRFIMRYPGGMVPFGIRIPDRVLVAGTNTIELVISPTSELTALVEGFARSSRSRHMGLLREVFLVGTPHVWTNDIRVRSSINGGNGSMNVKATIVGGTVERLLGSALGGDALTQGKATVSVEAMLRSRDGGQIVSRTGTSTVTIERSRQQIVNFQLSVANPQRWSVASPNLYDLIVRIERDGQLIDIYETPVGFRSIGVMSTDRGRQISINDSIVPIYAVDYVDDYPNRGPSMSWRQMELDVSLMKTLGVNVVKIRNGSPHPYFLSLCDRYGLMVMAELPTSDVPSDMILQEELLARYRNTSERSIAYLDSHPSVIAIGLSDGLEEGSDAVAQYHADLVQLYRKLSTKMLFKVVPAGLYDRTSEGGFDLIIIKFSTTQDRTRFERIVQALPKAFRSAAVITEFGSRLSPSNTNGFSDPLSNEAQALVVRDCFRASISAGLAGVMIWSFVDYSLERPTMLVDHYDSYVCTSGLLDVWRQPRISYAMLKSLINDEKEPLLQARYAAFDTPLVFIAAGIILALIMTFLINRSRRFREYLLRAIARPYNFYADIRDQRILSAVQTSFLGIVIASCVGLVISSLLYYVRVDAEIEYLLHLLIPSNVAYDVVRFVSWRPTLAVPLWSTVVMGLFVLAAFLLRVGSMFIKARIYFRDTLTIVVWSALPLVVLLPIGVALYQALSTDALSLWVPLLVIALTIWSLMRTLRATSVVFDVPSTIVYSIGLGLVVVALVAILISWNASYDAFSFVKFYFSVVSA